MRFSRLTHGLLAFALAACAGCSAPSEEPENVGTASEPLVIAGLFATGVNGAGVPLASGTTDAHYVLSSTDPALPGPNAPAVNAAAGWTGNTAGSKWISGRANTQGLAGGVYTYTTTFTLPAVAPAALAITGQWACDDSCVVLLNGTQVTQNPSPAWAAQANFLIPGGSPFQTGTNTLAFVVTNATGGPTGLQIGSLSGGCSTDDQCSAAQFCDTQTTLCAPKIANGSPIPTVPGHTPPLTGTCTPAVGTAVCTSGVCDVKDNGCGYADGDGPCSAGTGALLCRSGECSGDDLCEPNGGCNIDTDCIGGEWCDETTHVCMNRLANDEPMPTDGAHVTPTLDGMCNAAAAKLVCQTGVCDTDNLCGYMNGRPCSTGEVCRSSACSVDLTCMPEGGCNVDADCVAGNWCDESTHTCTADLANGTAMPDDPSHESPTLDSTCTKDAGKLVCVSKVCDTKDDKCGFAAGDGPCTQKDGGTVCRSGACSLGGTCEPPSGCEVDADCGAGMWCNESAQTCTSQLPNGTSVPTDPGHKSPVIDGICTSGVGAIVCTSGVCDTKDDQCGYANEDGPCNAKNGMTVCRSTVCSADGNCMPAGGCNVDADCTDPKTPVCNATTHMCATGSAGTGGGGASSSSGSASSGSGGAASGSASAGSSSTGQGGASIGVGGGSTGGAASVNHDLVAIGGGCNCRLGESEPASSTGALALLFGLAAAGRRRRKSTFNI